MRARRFLTALVLSAMIVGTSACAATPPPVSEKVAAAYEKNSTLAPTAQNQPATVFIGDSYIQGRGAGSPISRWTTVLSGEKGWSETNLGIGGTGYVAAAGDRTPYSESIQKAVAANPLTVIVSGGRNDVTIPMTSVVPAIDKFYDDLRAALPGAKIIALSPLWDSTEPPANLQTIASTVEAAASRVNAHYVDLGQPLQGHPEMITSDGVHPNDAGYAAIAQAVSAKL